MTKAKSKRTAASRANDSKITTRNGLKRATARKAAQFKSDAKPAAHQQRRSAPQPTTRRESKKAHIIAMLRASGGATIEFDGSCDELATPFDPRLPRRCRAQKAWSNSCLGKCRERARLPDHGLHGITGGVVRCGKHDRVRRRQPDCRWTTRSRICAVSISMACGRAGKACFGDSHLLICPVICCLSFSPTDCRPMNSVISIPLQLDC